jgi:5-carboxymethyl-2-hydroxymuconic-semialdehyde dehydrogenase
MLARAGPRISAFWATAQPLQAMVKVCRPRSMIMKQGAESLKRVHFELGGKDPVVVFDDADLDRALDAVIFMIYSLNGKRCT